ncbi:MAG: hypothetical protein L0154_18700 [Chloroflexi bacterium]|nr:hypothetical protein [Chloroflexota bacterium]
MKKMLSWRHISTRVHASEIDEINAELARDEAYDEFLQSLNEDAVEVMEEDEQLYEKKASA